MTKGMVKSNPYSRHSKLKPKNLWFLYLKTRGIQHLQISLDGPSRSDHLNIQDDNSVSSGNKNLCQTFHEILVASYRDPYYFMDGLEKNHPQQKLGRIIFRPLYTAGIQGFVVTAAFEVPSWILFWRIILGGHCRGSVLSDVVDPTYVAFHPPKFLCREISGSFTSAPTKKKMSQSWIWSSHGNLRGSPPMPPPTRKMGQKSSRRSPWSSQAPKNVASKNLHIPKTELSIITWRVMVLNSDRWKQIEKSECSQHQNPHLVT